MLSDRDIESWDKRLKNQANRGWDNYDLKRIDLSQARINEPLRIAGEFLCVSNSSSGSAVATVKINRTSNPSLKLEEDVEIKTIFMVLFISNEALPDQWIDLTFGINFEYKKKMIETGLPKTGQETEYQAGDDGTYEAGWLRGRLNANNKTRFSTKTIGGDLIVLDRATGLIWAADGNAAGCNNGAQDTWVNSISYANALTFAGFTDWRLPNVQELNSLVDYFAGSPTINTSFFPNTKTGAYWTGTTYMPNTLVAWQVGFNIGNTVNWNAKTTVAYLRCVRDGL